MLFIVVGAGHVGRYILKRVLNSGDRVIVIEKKFELCRVLERRYNIQTVNGDATVPDVLRRAGASRADVLIAATGSDGSNASVCKLAKSLGVPQVIAIANNPANKVEMKKAGADFVICPLEGVIATFEEVVKRADIVTLLHREEDNYKVVKYIVSPHSPIVGLRLKDVKLAAGASISLIRRGGKSIAPSPDHIFHAGDELLIQGDISAVEGVVKSLQAFRR